MAEDTERVWPSFDDILRELDAAGDARVRRMETSGLATSALFDELAQGMRLEDTGVAHDDFSPSLPEEPAALAEPLSPLDVEAPAPSLHTIDTSALEPIPEVDADSIEEAKAELAANAEIEAALEAPISEAIPDATFDPLTGELDWSAFDQQANAEPAKDAIEDWANSEPSWAAQPTSTEPLIFDQDDSVELQPKADETNIDGAGEDDNAEDLAGQIVELHGDSSDTKGWVTSTVDSPEGFDSVATADAIESDLSELFEIDTEPSNVIPIHATTEDNSEAVMGLDGNVEAPGQELSPGAWAGKRTKKRAEDPWAYMRPDPEDDVKKGFWKNRPKFFGGDERKARRAEREAELQAMVSDGDPSAPCADCGGESVVDLQDPSSGKLHLSCTACKKTWTEYTQLGKEA
ncbi:MAG: hypothetical protein HKN94_07625 [Acidimicrobiales bacterium]|nr:hypothetical protein [Acidimicrobiales bacterium]RZV47998.1 MAG: hypothetical protein EX269_03355 [Acidimicrobiales bacterium]